MTVRFRLVSERAIIEARESRGPWCMKGDMKGGHSATDGSWGGETNMTCVKLVKTRAGRRPAPAAPTTAPAAPTNRGKRNRQPK